MHTTPTASEIRKELNKLTACKAEIQRKLILEDRRLDVLAYVLGYDVMPFHWILIQAKRQLPGPWRLFLAPRGAGKSTILTVVDSVLLPLIESNVRILIGSRVKDQSKDILSEIQGCFMVDQFCELFGDLRGDKWGTGEATIKTRTRQFKEPTWLAAGADGPVTSKHFDYVKADDLVDEKNSRTDGERARIITFFYKTLVPTLMMVRADGTPGEMDLIGTRYHPDDVYGHAMDDDVKFQGNVCEIPALVNPETGEADPNGVSVIPEMLPTDDLKNLRISMGSANFDSQYQQSTKRMKGDIFKDEFFIHYDDDPEDLIQRLELKVWAACDLAIAEEEQQDEYADAVIGVDDRETVDHGLMIYVLDVYHGKIPYPMQISRAEYIFDRWDPIRFGVESTAFQRARLHAVYRELGAEIGDRCIPVMTLTDKVTRAWKLAARYEAGRVLHRRSIHLDLEDQLVGFPKGRFDDMFDAVDLAVTLGCVLRAKRTRKRKVGLFGGPKTRRVRRPTGISITPGGVR
jgi:predicted phage terminase large subunit-like protein